MVFILTTIVLSLLGFFVNNSSILVEELNLISGEFLSIIFMVNPMLSLFIIWSYCNIMNIKRQKRLNKYKSTPKTDRNVDCIGDGLMGIDCSDCIGVLFNCDDCVDCIECIDFSDGVDCGDCIDGADCLDCASGVDCSDGIDCGDCLSGADCGGIDCG